MTSIRCQHCGTSFVAKDHPGRRKYCAPSCANAAPRPTKTRKTNCKRGHPLSGANLYVAPNGLRYCRACSALRTRERRSPVVNREYTRRARLRNRYGYTGPWMTTNERVELLRGGACAYSDKGDCAGELELDHIVPISAGGKDERDNMQITCHRHNGAKGSAVRITYRFAVAPPYATEQAEPFDVFYGSGASSLAV